MRNFPLYIIDIVYCAVFTPLIIFLMPVERWWSSHPVFLGAFVAWLICNYFAFKYFVVPRFSTPGRTRIYAALAVTLSIAGTSVFATYEIQSPYMAEIKALREANPAPSMGIYHYKQAVWLHYIIVASFGTGLGILAEAGRLRRRRDQLEIERNRAELAAYKARINPHFLFNTLNSLYGLLITQSPAAVESMERFIGLVKYMYASADKDYITVAEEAQCIEEYIYLQSLRLNELARISFKRDLACPEATIPPMLLITFVENAFKHGISPDDPCFVDICIASAPGQVSFSVENSAWSSGVDSPHKGGIDNCQRRLHLRYPQRHSLEISNSGGVFSVKLTIKNDTEK